MEIKIPKIHIQKYFRITQGRQQKVYQEIRENALGDFDFFILTIFSTIIITLGLAIDSSAVVIGGMLITPLVWPVLAMALAIIKGRSRVVADAFFTLLKATLLILLVSLLVGLILPQASLGSSEILARSKPQLYELFIALASGFIGAFVISYPKLGNAMAGVVVAAALVPPLAAMGLLIARQDITGAGGAFLLYLSNLIALLFSAAILFYLVKFRGPTTEEEQEIQKSHIRWSLLFFLVIIIPLALITSNTITMEKKRTMVKQVLRTKVDDLQVEDIRLLKEDGITVIHTTVRSPQVIYKYQVEEMTDILSEKLGESVLLKITVVPVLEAGKLLPQKEKGKYLNNFYDLNEGAVGE